MDGYVPVLRGGVPAEEPRRPAVVHQAAVASIHYAAALTQRAGGPHPADQGRRARPRQSQLQEDEEDTDGRRR